MGGRGISLARTFGGVDSLKDVEWTSMPQFEARYGACVTYAETAKRLHVFAVSDDRRVHWSWSDDDGKKWSLPWGFVGQGLLDASPAAAVSPDGRHLNVFGLGKDRNIWRACSPDGGVRWTHLWSRSGLPDMEFSSAPACAVSNDGRKIWVMAKDSERYHFLRSEDSGQSWHQRKWQGVKRPRDSGFFISAPALCGNPDLSELHVFGVYSDMLLYHRRIRNNEFGPWSMIGIGEPFA